MFLLHDAIKCVSSSLIWKISIEWHHHSSDPIFRAKSIRSLIFFFPSRFSLFNLQHLFSKLRKIFTTNTTHYNNQKNIKTTTKYQQHNNFKKGRLTGRSFFVLRFFSPPRHSKKIRRLIKLIKVIHQSHFAREWEQQKSVIMKF